MVGDQDALAAAPSQPPTWAMELRSRRPRHQRAAAAIGHARSIGLRVNRAKRGPLGYGLAAYLAAACVGAADCIGAAR